MPDILTQKSYIQYNKLSRYNNVPTYFQTKDLKYFYGTGFQLDQDTLYTYYTAEKGDTWDTLALKFYADPGKYWILTDFNRILDPYKDIAIGTKIKVPSISNIRFK